MSRNGVRGTGFYSSTDWIRVRNKKKKREQRIRKEIILFFALKTYHNNIKKTKVTS